jgi:hypothetical protein
MGGVNIVCNYVDTTGFGHWEEATGQAKVDHTLLKGGIVSIS